VLLMLHLEIDGRHDYTPPLIKREIMPLPRRALEDSRGNEQSAFNFSTRKRGCSLCPSFLGCWLLGSLGRWPSTSARAYLAAGDSATAGLSRWFCCRFL
jgi:hypothetical protein